MWESLGPVDLVSEVALAVDVVDKDLAGKCHCEMLVSHTVHQEVPILLPFNGGVWIVFFWLVGLLL